LREINKKKTKKKIMETNGRNITIINNKTQSQKVIEGSTATTLGELKAEMSKLGIPYVGTEFYEGHIRATLKDDASILPSNIEYKGQVVNDLTFILSTPNKKIESGMATRKELYAEIAKRGLKGDAIAKYGKNFTQCSNSQLEELISKSKPAAKATPEAKTPVVELKSKKVISKVATVKSGKDVEVKSTSNLERAFRQLVEALNNVCLLTSADYANIMGTLAGTVAEPAAPVEKKATLKVKDAKISQAEINEMLGI
jgi:hypothetical protein